MDFGNFPLHHNEPHRYQLSTAVKESKKNYFKVGQPVVFQLNNYVITIVMNERHVAILLIGHHQAKYFFSKFLSVL